MIEPSTSGHRNGGVARKDAGQVSAASAGIHLTWILPSTAACPGAPPPLRRPCRNCKTASYIRKRWRAHENGVSVHMHPVVYAM